MPKFGTREELQHLISSAYLYHEFDTKRIQQIGGMLADPQNTFVSVLSKSFKDEDLLLLEPWYSIKHSAEKYPEHLSQAMLQPQVKENGKKLDLPPANNLLPSDFAILAENKDHSAQPVFAQQWDNAELWFKKDDHFKQPKGNIAVKIYTTDCNFGITQ